MPVGVHPRERREAPPLHSCENSPVPEGEVPHQRLSGAVDPRAPGATIRLIAAMNPQLGHRCLGGARSYWIMKEAVSAVGESAKGATRRLRNLDSMQFSAGVSRNAELRRTSPTEPSGLKVTVAVPLPVGPPAFAQPPTPAAARVNAARAAEASVLLPELAPLLEAEDSQGWLAGAWAMAAAAGVDSVWPVVAAPLRAPALAFMALAGSLGRSSAEASRGASTGGELLGASASAGGAVPARGVAAGVWGAEARPTRKPPAKPTMATTATSTAPTGMAELPFADVMVAGAK